MIYYIALIVFLLPSYLVRFSIFGIPTTLLEVLIYIAAIITLIQSLKLKNQNENLKFKIENLKLFVPIVLFIIAGIISVLISPNKHEALGLFKAYIFDPILFFFVILLNFKKDDFQLIFKALILSGVLVAIQAIYQKLTGQVTLDGRVVGIFGYSPNYLALYLAPLTVLTFGYEFLGMNPSFFQSHSEADTTSAEESRFNMRSVDSLRSLRMTIRKIWPYDLALFLMFLALWFSGSRAAIGAVIIGAVSYFVIKYWSGIKVRKIIVTLLYCSIAILLIVGWFMVKPDWQASSGSGRISSSNNIRWEIWKTTVNDIIPASASWRINWLLGIGLGNYQNYFIELTQDRVNYPEWISPMALTPHNLFLTIWVNLGLLGLIAFIWLLYLFFYYMLHATCYKNKLTSFSLILIAAMITILIQGLVDAQYWKNDLAIMFWLILSLIVIEKN